MTQDEIIAKLRMMARYPTVTLPRDAEALKRAADLLQAALETNEFNPDWDAMAVMVEEQQRMAKRIEELEAKDEPVAFKIYKPTPPRGATPNVRDAELPWVYDQDPSSGNVASMWVTPVKAAPPQPVIDESAAKRIATALGWEPKRKSLTDEEIQKCYETTGHYQKLRPQDRSAVFALARAIESAHGITGEQA